MILVDAIVPVYNVEPYLHDCIESLLRQKIPFHKVILINDGSTDKSKETCEEYCNKYSNIELVNQENHGLGYSRNVGINQSRADYVVFIDSDDFVSERMTERILNELEVEQVDALIYNASEQYDIRVERPQNYFEHSASLNNNIMSGIQYFIMAFPSNYIVSACIAAYRRKFLLQNNICFPEGIYHEDYFFYMQVWLNAKTVKCIADALYIRRYRENSITTSRYCFKRCKDLIKGKLIEWEYIRKFEGKIEDWIIRLFILNETAKILNILQDNGEPKWKMAEQFLNEFWIRWGYLLQEDLSWSESYLVLQIINLANNYSQSKIHEKKDMRLLRSKCSQKLEEGIRFRVLQSSLCTNRRIGIYGVGAHTALLIELYEKYVGKMNPDALFIVTEENEQKMYHGRKIITYNQLSNDIDCVIISSRVYQEQMIDNLKKMGINDSQLIILYNNNDVCDITQAYKMLTEGKDKNEEEHN